VAQSLFGSLGQNNSLKALHLRNTKLSDAVIEALKSDMNDMLRQIDLKNNGLTDASLEQIKLFLDSHYHVIGFDLDGNKISTAHLSEVEKLLERNYSITNVMDDLLNAVPYRRKHAISRTRIVTKNNTNTPGSNTNLSTSPSSPPNRFNRSYSKTGPKKQLDPLEEFPWLALVNFEKFPKINVSNRFNFGLSDTIGRREAMEDAVIVHGQFREKGNEDLFALFDGHGGREVADYCAKSLAVCLKHKLSTLGEDQIGEAMTQAYVEIDRSIQGWAKYVGCTALSAYFIDHFFYIANVGDSRVVLAQAGKAQRLSTDHKPEHPDELKRIKEAGGFVNGGRVKGLLSVSRAIGDALLTPVIAVPDIIKHEINDTDELLIMACDGLWDVIGDQLAVNLIRDETDMQTAAEKLRNYALDHGSTDNISVLVIDLKSFSINRKKLAEATNNTNQIENDTNNNDDDNSADEKEQFDQTEPVEPVEEKEIGDDVDLKPTPGAPTAE
jgi:serine/threonine protein phosphatase PrpC